MKTFQFVTRRKGGGGTTTNSTIPDWAVPYLKNVGDTAEAAYGSGALSKVADTSELQNQAFTTGANDITDTTKAGIDALQGSTGRLQNIAETGSGFTGGEALKEGATMDAKRALAGIGNTFGAAGTLGSARQALAEAGVQTDLAAKFAGIDKDIAEKNAALKLQAEQGIGNAATTGANLASGEASGLSNLGGQQRTIDQQQQDADWQALNRYASTIYGNPARQQTIATPGGK